MDIYNTYMTRQQFEELAAGAVVVRLWHIAAVVAVLMSPLAGYGWYLHVTAQGGL